MKKNKRIILSTGFALLTILTLSVFYTFTIAEPKRISTCGLYISSSTLNELEDRADLIVLASTPTPFSKRESVITQYGDGTVQDFYTLTDISIKEVYKSDNSNIVPGSSLSIIEPLAQVNSRKILSTNGYQEILHGEDYILFLVLNSFGNYTITNMNLGTFSKNDINLINTDSQDSEYNEAQETLTLEVMNKYFK